MSMLKGRFLLSRIYDQQIRTRTLKTVALLYNKNTASFEEVKSVGSNSNVVLVDVREPSELQEDGTIPGSVNIPLGEVESALRDMKPQQFQNKYGIQKPEVSTPIIFSCRSGRRSGTAQEIATKLGFKNIKNYEGGWMDWAERNK